MRPGGSTPERNVLQAQGGERPEADACHRWAVSEDAADRSIIIPLYYPMADSDIEYVIETFMTFAKAR